MHLDNYDISDLMHNALEESEERVYIPASSTAAQEEVIFRVQIAISEPAWRHDLYSAWKDEGVGGAKEAKESQNSPASAAVFFKVSQQQVKRVECNIHYSKEQRPFVRISKKSKCLCEKGSG